METRTGDSSQPLIYHAGMARPRRLPWLLGPFLVGSLLLSPAVHAGPLGWLLEAGKLGKAAKAAKAAKLAAIGGGVAFADARAAQLFRLLPDDAGRTAVYVSRSDDGLLAIGRGGRLDDAGNLAEHLRGSDVYVDTPSLLRSSELPAAADDARWFALDAQGTPRPLSIVEGESGALRKMVEVGEDVTMDALQFALDQTANADPSWTDERPLTVLAAVSACAGPRPPLSDEALMRTLTSGPPRRFLVLTDQEPHLAKFAQAAGPAGHDLTVLQMTPPCGKSNLPPLLSRIQEQTQAGRRAPLIDAGPITMQPFLSMDPMAA